ncbi:MAG: PIN domain-containing protein [Clostridia bacterium]|nr:MAG: PIN domain-containing protein [Clostridia bacterium]
MAEAYFIDTNIIMYARGKEHPYRESCSLILLKIADGSFQDVYGTPVVDTEVFQEILYRYGMEQRWTVALSVCRDLMAIGVELLPVGMKEIEALLDITEKYAGQRISPRDLVHAAVMAANGIGNIITADTHFDLIGEIRRIDPGEVTW